VAITYQPITERDKGFCILVHHLAMRDYVEPLWGWDEARQDLLALNFIDHPDSTHEIALIEGKPIGYLSYQDRAKVVYLEILCLHPDHQRRGHGSEIVSRLIRLAKSRRKPLELSCLRARVFYERHGFIKVASTAQRIHMRISAD
jgi:GNAT superfamily N-acetyltransferase